MDLNSLLIGAFAGGALIALFSILYFRGTMKQWRSGVQERLVEKETELLRLRDENHKISEDNTLQVGELESLRATLAHERGAAQEKLQLLEEAKKNLLAQFENAANKIFEEKSARLTGQNVEKLQEILKPFKDQLGDFKKKVEDVYDKEGKERVSLLSEIKQLKDLNNRISKEATDLTQALKGESKTRGNWGELILERVLEQSGLTNGREYETQLHLKDKFGGQQGRFPDVVVHLPEDRDVIIDAKVALNAYERYVNAGDAAQKQAALKEHIGVVRNHFRELSDKKYQDLDGIKPMELVLMCVPNESAFITAVSEDASLHDDAMSRHVVLVGPTTLLLTLRIIASMWRTEYQNRNAQLIAKRGQELYDKFVGFVDDLTGIGEAIEKAGQSYQEAYNKLTSGRGNLVGQAEKLIELGVKAGKRLPAALTDLSEEHAPADVSDEPANKG